MNTQFDRSVIRLLILTVAVAIATALTVMPHVH